MLVAALAVLTAPVANSPETIARPRDIWAFRSVLDRHPRMLTLALSPDVWSAYDATHGGLYKIWKGGVKFDGAVYTSSHGPQPTSEGVAYVQHDPTKPVWFWRQNGKDTAATVRFRGYRIKNNVAELHLELPLGNGRAVRIFETPDAANGTYERPFRFEGLPRDRQLVLKVGGDNQQLDGIVAEGATVGSDGFAVFSSPKARLTYRLKPFQFAQQVFSDVFPVAEPEPSAEAQRRVIPGVTVRVYDIGQDMRQIPNLVAAQTPNKNFVARTINFQTPADFGGFSDQFLVHITGEIEIKQAGRYEFRLSSDDGSVFWIRDTQVINNDGLHSETAVEGNIDLAAGFHPLRIEYFENSADNVLRLEWKKPGDTEWTGVPEEVLSTPEGEVRVTSPGKKNVILVGAVRRPGDREPEAGVHPSFNLTTVRPPDFRPRVGGIDFLPDGRMVVCTWDADGAVYIVSGVLGDAKNVRVKRIAKGLAEPLGLKTVGKRIFVLQKQELTELIDHDGDEVTDEYYALANGWGVTDNFHEFAFGLVHHRGHFYANLAIAINPGGASTQPQNPDRGKVVRINDRTGEYDFPASGLRTPNGIGFGYKGGIFITDNQGDWLPSSKLLHYTPGAFFGSRAVDPKGPMLPVSPPVAWLPQGEIGNSPSEPNRIDVGPYKGQMIHGDVTHGGVKRVFVEEINGVLQGTVFRFTQGLEGGVNRIQWGPDGALYVGGIGATGNWGQEGKERFGLQKLTYNGKTTFEMLAVRTKTDGLEIELTEPIADGMGNDPSYFELESWRYEPTPFYGGPKLDIRRHAAKSVHVSRDRRRVFLEIPELQPGRVVYLRLDPTLRSKTGQGLWSTEGWLTMNEKPKNARGFRQANPTTNVEAGFTPLFNGKDLTGWKGWRRNEIGGGWQAVDGELRFVPGISGGDLRTAEMYDNFELRLEWKVGVGGNSGIFYRSTEEFGAPWETGPEMQVLDNERHPDGRSPLTSAGSNYALHPTDMLAARGAGKWNQVRLVVNGNHVEHWLNGVLVVKYELNSADWKNRVRLSKFAGMAAYGQRSTGFIVLQDHGDPVSYRNIRIKRL